MLAAGSRQQAAQVVAAAAAIATAAAAAAAAAASQRPALADWSRQNSTGWWPTKFCTVLELGLAMVYGPSY
jgi:hypothetical protein